MVQVPVSKEPGSAVYVAGWLRKVEGMVTIGPLIVELGPLDWKTVTVSTWLKFEPATVAADENDEDG